MQITIHRGTCQIGGLAVEIRTANTRIIIDMGEELPSEHKPFSTPLSIPGVTCGRGACAAVLLTHYHGDHCGQLKNLRKEIPLYMGRLTKEVLLASLTRKEDFPLKTRVAQARTFLPAQPLVFGDITVTPFWVDHSACDSYMFLVEAEGKRILHTGDFRLHGFRGKALPRFIQGRLKQPLDALILEGTSLSRSDGTPVTERQLQQAAKSYMKQYPYVFVLAASTQLERMCALAKAVPAGKYFICDEYQSRLLDLLQQQWGALSPLYRNIKKVVYGKNLQHRLEERGFLMMVRDNRNFRAIIRRFDPARSVILYSMWDGYRTRPGSSLGRFLQSAGRWAPLHTSGHASRQDLKKMIEQLNPAYVLPVHTEAPQALKIICPIEKIKWLKDGEAWVL